MNGSGDGSGSGEGGGKGKDISKSGGFGGGMGGGFFNLQEEVPGVTLPPPPAVPEVQPSSPDQPNPDATPPVVQSETIQAATPSPAQAAGLASLDFQLPERGRVYYFLTPRGEVSITAQAVSGDLLNKLIYLAVALAVIVVISAALRAAGGGHLAWLTGPRANVLMICLGALAMFTGILPLAGAVIFLIGLILPVRRATLRAGKARAAAAAK